MNEYDAMKDRMNGFDERITKLEENQHKSELSQKDNYRDLEKLITSAVEKGNEKISKTMEKSIDLIQKQIDISNNNILQNTKDIQMLKNAEDKRLADGARNIISKLIGKGCELIAVAVVAFFTTTYMNNQADVDNYVERQKLMDEVEKKLNRYEKQNIEVKEDEHVNNQESKN